MISRTSELYEEFTMWIDPLGVPRNIATQEEKTEKDTVETGERFYSWEQLEWSPCQQPMSSLFSCNPTDSYGSKSNATFPA